MLDFKAYFWDSDVYINEKYRYDTNEILTAYLNDDRFEYISESNFIDKLQLYKRRLEIFPDMDYGYFKNYNKNVYSAIALTEELNSLIFSLPPFDKILKFPVLNLDDIMNGGERFFENGLSTTDYLLGYVDEDFMNEYGYGEQDEYGRYNLRLNKFDLCPLNKSDLQDEDTADDLRELNKNVSFFFDIYIGFLNEYLQINQIYKTFICGYLNNNKSFLTANETARCFEKFNRERGKNFEHIKCGMRSFGYKAITDKSGNKILCEEIKFNDLGSFIYYDFFNGLKQNFIPNQCKNCGKFFLINGGYYYSYCSNPLVNEPNKTCRDVGSKRRYEDRCKNDPIWRTYNRAYKAHYARYMKKKITVLEFEEWSRFASEIRDKALSGKIPFETYYDDIRK